MKKRIFGMLLMGAMVIASVSMFTSCKDYDDDINKLQSQIDAITAQNLQTQLTSLQTALTAAQTAADAAKSAAAQAATAAQAAQTTADSKASAGDAEAAKAAAEAAQAAADAAQATADAAAKAQDVKDLQDAIANLKDIIDGKVSADDLKKAIEGVEAKIAAIEEGLLTLDDVKKLLEDEGFASAAAIEDLKSQLTALNAFKAEIEKLGLSEEWMKKVDDAIASLTQIKKDIAAKASQSSVDDLKKSVDKAVAAMGTVDGFADAINKA